MKKRITNKLGLPLPVVRAVENDPYDAGHGDYSVTTLLSPPRMVALERTCEIVEDAADNVAALDGQVMHLLLERAAKDLEAEGYVVEKRFYKTYKVEGKDFVVSAQVDLFDPAKGLLSDYKYTSVAASKYGLKKEYCIQVNVQAELVREAGFQVDSGEIVLRLKDWSAERVYNDYPKAPWVKQVVPMMSSQEVSDWIVERIRAHEAARVSLPQCSAEERWNRGSTFAVMVPGADKATRVCSNLASANAFITAKATRKEQGMVVVERPGLNIRCLRYCPARHVCEQAKANKIVPVLGEDGFYKL